MITKQLKCFAICMLNSLEGGIEIDACPSIPQSGGCYSLGMTHWRYAMKSIATESIKYSNPESLVLPQLRLTRGCNWGKL
jgi:hypothetical protein